MDTFATNLLDTIPPILEGLEKFQKLLQSRTFTREELIRFSAAFRAQHGIFQAELAILLNGRWETTSFTLTDD